MSACVAYITFITKVTLKFIYDTLLIYDQRLCLFHFQFLFKFSARLDGFVYFQAQILKLFFFFTNSAEFWSLNGKTTRTVFSVPWAVDKGRGWSQTFESTKRLIVEFTSCFGYFRREKTDFKRSHSSEKCDQEEDKRCARSSIVLSKPFLYRLSTLL